MHMYKVVNIHVRKYVKPGKNLCCTLCYAIENCKVINHYYQLLFLCYVSLRSLYDSAVKLSTVPEYSMGMVG